VRAANSELCFIKVARDAFSATLPFTQIKSLRIGRAMPRRYRNRRIGEFLKELEFTEGRSTGIPKIMEAMEKNGSPPAEFEFDHDHSYFMVRLPVHSAALEVAKMIVDDLEVVGTELTQIGDQAGTELGLSPDQVKLLNKAVIDLGITDLMLVVGRTNRIKFRDQLINPLLLAGYIKMTIPDKPRSSKQKYRITQKGCTALASLKVEGDIPGTQY
jgi:ATP-dependent DNA helicase RecG